MLLKKCSFKKLFLIQTSKDKFGISSALSSLSKYKFLIESNIDELAKLVSIEHGKTFDDAKTKEASDKTSGNNKLKALGLTDDEIEAIIKG